VTLVSIGKSRDDVSEGGERLVDVLGLVKDRTFGSGFADLHNIENKGFFLLNSHFLNLSNLKLYLTKL
jgi:hypothetical protein